MKTSDRQMFALLEPTVRALGLELWGIEHLRHGKSSLLRIYIDKASGVGIEDCERVSRQVSALLDVEDPIAGEYTLEVSSPGEERRLFTPQQFDSYIGSRAMVRLRSLRDGRRNFRGKISKVEDGNVILDLDGEEVRLSFSDVEKAHILSDAAGPERADR